MELNEMEQRMLYQTEGNERYALMHDLLLASRYAKDPDRRRAADSLMEKMRPLTDGEFMEIVHDIRRNYRLPREGRAMGELLAEARQRSGAEQLKGHDIMALERFDPEVRHMVVFEVFSEDSFDGEKGDRVRLFLTDVGYEKFQCRQKIGEIKIQDHVKVLPGGYLQNKNKEKEHIR